jgi:uncharacterized ion transporter superfamily protein YfcC
MAALAIAGVKYQTWIRFFFPIFLTWSALSIVVLVIAQLIGWS